MHKMNKKNIIIWLIVITLATLIFVMSGMDSNESNFKSKKTLYEIVEKIVEITNEMGITNKHPSENSMKNFIDKHNYLFRKIAHVSEYCIFTILLLIALKNSGMVGKKVFIIGICICFLYACSDEFHQLFVNGRTSQFTDCLIDTLGSFIGCIIYYFACDVHKKNTKLSI